jgi:hypothetical protein
MCEGVRVLAWRWSTSGTLISALVVVRLGARTFTSKGFVGMASGDDSGARALAVERDIEGEMSASAAGEKVEATGAVVEAPVYGSVVVRPSEGSDAEDRSFRSREGSVPSKGVGDVGRAEEV